MTAKTVVPAAVERLRSRRVACLMLHVPQWFRRQDFRAWRQGRAEGQWQAPACWQPEVRHGRHTDVFLVFERRRECEPEPGEPPLWDGSDLIGLPYDIYEAIGGILAERRLRYGLLWLRPT